MACAAAATRSTTRAASSPSTPRSTACRSRSSRPTGCRATPTPTLAGGRGARAARAEPPADHVPAARRLPHRAVPTSRSMADFDDDSHAPRRQDQRSPPCTDVQGVVGERDEHALDESRRPSAPAGRLRARQRYVVNQLDLAHDGDADAHPASRSSSRSPSAWLDECVTYEPGCDRSMLLAVAEWRATGRRAALRVDHPLPRGTATACCTPMLRPLRPRGLHRRRRTSSPARSSSHATKSPVNRRDARRHQGQHVGGDGGAPARAPPRGGVRT